MLRSLKTLAVFALLMLVMAACQPAAAPGTSSTADAETRGHLDVSDDYSFGLASTLDPHNPNRYYTYAVMAFEGLNAKDHAVLHIHTCTPTC